MSQIYERLKKTFVIVFIEESLLSNLTGYKKRYLKFTPVGKMD